MSGPKIVLWRPMYDPEGKRQLESAGSDVTVVDSAEPDDLKAALPGARGLWVRYPQAATEDILDAAGDLVVLSTSGFGYDKIDIAAATRRGILVVNNQGFGRIPVSEHTLMLTLATMKQLLWSDAAARDGSGWDQRSGMEIYELEGKTVGIVGLGWIGSELARKLRLAFRCRVLGYDPYVDPRLATLAEVERVGDLTEFLGRCEILCLCPELTETSRGMIGAKELAALPGGAFVINTSRGQVLDLDALAAAVDSGHVAGAGLDVYEPEPLPAGHPILEHKRIMLTPHTAGLSAETTTRMTHNAIAQLLAAVRGEMPPFPLNPEAWDGPQSRRPRPNT